MALLSPLTREEVHPEVRALWDECERVYPEFRHLWATQAHSPTIFRHIWGELLELRRSSPVPARLFEIGIVVASTLTRCRYCVSHHAPLAEAAGLAPERVESLTHLTLEPLGEGHEFPPRPGWTPEESLVIDLASFVVWSGIQAQASEVHPRIVQQLRRRLLGRLRERFSPRQIEELTWRIVQCVAFNWHNDLLEIDIEPGVQPRDLGRAAPATHG